MLAPVILAAWISNTHAVSRFKSMAVERAAVQLDKANKVSMQLLGAIGQLSNGVATAPCAPESIQEMRQLVLKMNQLLDVGYMQDNKLICSSFGREPLWVGDPTYRSDMGYLIRLNVVHPGSSGSYLHMVTDEKTGFTALVHPETVVDILPVKAGESHGLVGISSGRLIASVGRFDPRWLSILEKDSSGVENVDGGILAWQRSEKYDYTAFASVSADAMADSVQQTLMLLVPVGLVAGLLIAQAVLSFVRHQTSMPSLIRTGLKNNEFFTVYQPIVDLATGRWVGAEALVRWRRGTGEMIGPDTFIPIAESTGLIGGITMRVLDLVEADAAVLFAESDDFFVSINFSAEDFSSAEIIERVTRFVKRAHIEPARLHIEATERVFMDVEVTQRNVARLREIGVLVSIDDFGTGYSSLSQLAGVELDALKIDRVFVQTVGTESVTSSVIHHIIGMAKGLRLKIIAEGVETEAQAQYLREQGVEFAQGWLFSRPVAAGEFERKRTKSL